MPQSSKSKFDGMQLKGEFMHASTGFYYMMTFDDLMKMDYPVTERMIDRVEKGWKICFDELGKIDAKLERFKKELK